MMTLKDSSLFRQRCYIDGAWRDADGSRRWRRCAPLCDGGRTGAAWTAIASEAQSGSDASGAVARNASLS